MSQSHSPTRAPLCSNATARFAATVDLPTPPLPLATARTCLTPGIRTAGVPAPAPPGGAWISIKTLALPTPSIVPKARSASFLIAAGTFGSLVARASCTLISPSSICIDFTSPNETMSRVKPGYFTVFNAFLISSSEIDIHKAYLRLTGGKPCALGTISTQLPGLVIHPVSNLVIVSAGKTSRLLIGFRHEIWILPFRPISIFRLHGIRREMKIENPVFVARKFENEQPPREELRCRKVFLALLASEHSRWNYWSRRLEQI